MDRTHSCRNRVVKTLGFACNGYQELCWNQAKIQGSLPRYFGRFYRSPCRSLFAWGREEGKSFVFDQFALPGTLYPAVSLKLSRITWEWLRPETSGHFVNVFSIVRYLPCICGTGKIICFLQWALGDVMLRGKSSLL